jgi:hypothetical protein
MGIDRVELKHLAPYLPYGFSCTNGNEIVEVTIQNLDMLIISQDEFKPILRPLSDLDSEITIGKDTFIPIDRLGWKLDLGQTKDNGRANLSSWLCRCDYALSALYDVQLLFEWHFDVYELIDKGLAIDINTIKK